MTLNQSSLKWINYLLGLISLGYICLFVIIASQRLFYPYELEWTEGAFLDQIFWITAGHTPYSPPSIYHIPTLYSPFYFLVSAILAKIIGASFIAPRLVSILSTLVFFILLFLIIKHLTKNHSAGILAAGAYAACYRFSGAWMDLAKTDSLVLVILLLAFYIVQKSTHWKGLLCGGALFTLAYFTKQIALPVIAITATGFMVFQRSKTWLVWITTGLSALLLFILLEHLSDGWFSFYTIRTGSSHALISDYLIFWKTLLLKFLPTAISGIAYLFVLYIESRKNGWKLYSDCWITCIFSAALIASSWMINFKVWTYDNGFMPACMGFALLTGLAYAQFIKPYSQRSYGKYWYHNISTIQYWGFSLLFMVQMALLLYNPIPQMPSKANWEAWDAFVHRIESLPGEVLVFQHGYVNTLANKPQYFHSAPLFDVLAAKGKIKGALNNERVEITEKIYKNAIANQSFDWIILDRENVNWAPYYLYIENITDETNNLMPLTGAMTQPSSLLIKNPIARGGTFPVLDPIFNPYFIQGWGDIYGNARWINHQQAVIKIFLEKKNNYLLLIRTVHNCANPFQYPQDIQIYWNNEFIGLINLQSCVTQESQFTIKNKMIKKTGNQLVLGLPISPSGNMTTSYVGIQSLTFIQQSP